MAWIKYNPNPTRKQTIDCVVRAISVAEGITWDQAFAELTAEAFKEKDMPSYNPTWANYLEKKGYHIYGIPNTCPRCYTVAQFALDHLYGTYVLGTGSHAIAVIDGNYIDTWDSGNEVPMYFFMKGDRNDEDTDNPAITAATIQPTNSTGTIPTTDTSNMGTGA